MSEDKTEKILQLIKNDKSFENYFFNKLASSTKPLEWLIPLKNAGYFEPQKNPRPQELSNKKGYYTVPHWNILNALSNMSAKNGESPSKEVSELLVEIIDKIIHYRDNDGERIDNYRTDWKLMEIISHLPIEHIQSKHIQFIKEALNPKIGSSLLSSEIGKLFLPKLVKHEAIDLILELLDAILDYKKTDREHSDKYISVTDTHWLKSALDKNKKGIAKLCSIRAAQVAIFKIHKILEEDETQFNYIWIPTIEEHEQTSFPDEYECQLVRFVRDMLEESPPKEIESEVIAMLNSNHDIFKRLAYHLINHHYKELNHLLWGLTVNPLDGISTHELFELLKNNCQRMSEEQIQTVLRWIESQEFYIPKEKSEDIEWVNRYKARYKKEWLLALLGSNNPDVIREYTINSEIFPHEIEHPGFQSWSETGSIKEISPIEEEELLKMSNSQIAEYINNYSEDSESEWRGLEKIELSSAIRQFVSNNPEKFSIELSSFLSVPRKYQYALLRGLEEAWRSDRDYDWSYLLPFMLHLVQEDAFWREEKKESSDDYDDSILGTIADLIREGTRSDKHAFALNLLPISESILLILLERTRSKMRIWSDLVTSVLNSTRGKVFLAAVNYSLRYARQLDKKVDERWSPAIKNDFTKRLDRAYEPSLEFSVVLGEYLLNLVYLDRKWVYDNINCIFNKGNKEHWEAAFIGHLVLSSTVYEEFYKLLKENGHYKKGLATSFTDKHTEDKLVQHIAIGYLAGWEDLDSPESLISELLILKKASHLSALVNFIWTFRDKGDKDLPGKIRPLWNALITSMQQTIANEEYGLILADLSKWLALVDKLDDEVYNWIVISLNAMRERWDSHYLAEYLLKHVNSTPDLVADIFLKMLNFDIYPDYTEENIIALVNALYTHGVREKANRICNLYGSKGFVFLRETFEKNNR